MLLIQKRNFSFWNFQFPWVYCCLYHSRRARLLTTSNGDYRKLLQNLASSQFQQRRRHGASTSQVLVLGIITGSYSTGSVQINADCDSRHSKAFCPRTQPTSFPGSLILPPQRVVRWETLETRLEHTTRTRARAQLWISGPIHQSANTKTSKKLIFYCNSQNGKRKRVPCPLSHLIPRPPRTVRVVYLEFLVWLVVFLVVNGLKVEEWGFMRKILVQFNWKIKAKKTMLICVCCWM